MEADAALDAKRSLQPYFTHITVHGCNLAGLANVFACIGAMFLTILSCNGLLGAVVLVLAVCGCCAFDFVFRVSFGSGGRLIRLISPHAGGALLYIPVWAVYPALAVYAIVMLLHKG